jgi:hypothetical protein
VIDGLAAWNHFAIHCVRVGFVCGCLGCFDCFAVALFVRLFVWVVRLFLLVYTLKPIQINFYILKVKTGHIYYVWDIFIMSDKKIKYLCGF